MRIFDESVQDEPDAALHFSVFRPETDMPDVRCGDVVIVLAAKVGLLRSQRNTPWVDIN